MILQFKGWQVVLTCAKEYGSIMIVMKADATNEVPYMVKNSEEDGDDMF